MAESFGALLREIRAAAGISMGQLAKRVNYSKSYLSKIENDLKPPNETLARLCDGTLDAGGRLIDAARTARAPATLDRRQVLAAGTVLGFALAGGPRPATDERVITGMRTMFEHLRTLATHTSPTVVLDPLTAHVRTLHALAAENPEPIRKPLLLLAARVAEHTGWMHQEAGNERAALWWTRHAANLARAGGDREIEAYAYVREAGLALYRQDPISTIELARRAQQFDRITPRTAALAARREAQGHALAGNRPAFDRAIDQATTLLSTSDEPHHPALSTPGESHYPALSTPGESHHPALSTPGESHYPALSTPGESHHPALSTPDESHYPALGTTAPNPLELAHAWSLCDLGLAAQSAELLDRALLHLPTTSRRTRARFATRRSLAYALSGEIDQSCQTLEETLTDAAHVDSATIRTDLRDLARTLSRWRTHPPVQSIYPTLSRVLHQHH